MVCAALLAAAGCDNTPTTPTGGGRTSATQVFSGTIAPGETPSQVFTLPGSSPLQLMFATLTDSTGFPMSTPLTVQFGIVPSTGGTCSPLTTATSPPALQAQISLSASSGAYCVGLANSAALTATANYSIRITYGTATSNTDAGTIEYSSSVEAGGFTARSFEAGAKGVVTILVDAIAPASVASLGVGVGLQRNDGSGCDLSVAGSSTRASQFSVPVDLGRYCVKVFDQGTLTGTTTFTLRISHP